MAREPGQAFSAGWALEIRGFALRFTCVVGPGRCAGSFEQTVKARRTYILVGLIVVVALGLVLPAVQVCRDWAFIDRNSGSRKGYRDWSFGWRSGLWYQESAIEAFMRSKHPDEFRQDWVSYAGTGRNVFGGATLHGHGRPGRIISLKPEMIENYCRSASESEKRRLYDVFVSRDEERIQALVDQIIERTNRGTGQ